MNNQNQPIILLDDEEDDPQTPIRPVSKKPRPEFQQPDPNLVVLIDDPTPQKPTAGPSSTPLFVPETPLSDLAKSEVSVLKCSFGSSLNQARASNSDDDKFAGIRGVICLESDNEYESDSGRLNLKMNESQSAALDTAKNVEQASSSRIVHPLSSPGKFNVGETSIDVLYSTSSFQPDTAQGDDDNYYAFCDFAREHYCPEEENFSMERIDNMQEEKGKKGAKDRSCLDEVMGKKKMTKEERTRLMEEKKRKKEEEKLQKAALKAQAAELKKLEKEKQKWEKGKFALKSIVAEIDNKIVELGSVGGQLLTRFAEKGLTYRIKSNPIERSIVWTMSVPEHLSQLSPTGTEIPYVLFVYDADEFCNQVTNEALLAHACRVRSQYPSYTISYLTNRLQAYLNKREKEQYKNPANSGWRRPPIEEALAKLTINLAKVHSRQCIDEAEIAEHVVGLTCSLASCQFRKKLTRLSVNANGALVPKDCVDKNLIKKNLWLKTLVAIPKVQPRFAIGIWKKYPTMKSLLSVYMDPTKSVHEKEFMLKDLTVEGLVGGNRRLGEVCSKRVYRILMAQSGSLKTDDIEEGADFF